MAAARNSDRWITPGVIITFLLVVGLVVAAIVGGVAYLMARGIDPDPMLKLATTLGAAVFSVGTFVLQLAQRSQNSKTERNTGALVGVAHDTLAAIAAPAPAPAPAPVPAGRPAPSYAVEPDYDDEDLADDGPDDTRVAVPAIPPLPQRLRRRTDTR